MGLGQWWSLQELVSRHSGRFICSEFDHLSCCHNVYIPCLSRQDGTQLAVGYISVSIALAIFIAILAFQVGNVTGITQYFNRKCTALKRCIIPIGDEEVEIESDTDSLSDRLINAIQYEPVPQTAQEHTAAAPTRSNVTRMLIPVYTP